ncbi:MAG: ATP-dependent RecD-like DNA helicase [Candidatus Eisenbacteria bacterium]
MPSETEPAVVEGTLERIVYANEETAWCVVRVSSPGRREPITAVGNLLGVQPGEAIRMTGRWMTDRRYGEQLRVDSYLTVQPSTLAGMEKYLGSGLIRGIGKEMARRIVERFGLESLEVIETDPGRLTEVDGIGPVRRDRIREAWKEQREIKQVMLFLQSNGVATQHAIRIWKQYGERAIAIVRENPYRLALDVFGIGFKTADRIAQNLGIPKDSPRRAEAGLLHLLGAFSDEGSVYVPEPRLLEAAIEALEVDETLLRSSLDHLAREGRIVREALPESPDSIGETQTAVFLKSLHTAETGFASLLVRLLAAPARPIPIDVEAAIAWFERTRAIDLAPEQREAIRRAITSKVLVVTGGPGTGKTTLVNGILRILEKKGRQILLAAPTGRAAKRLAESTGRQARTIHRLLEFQPKSMRFAHDQKRPLEADLVIVDEFSMVDIVLAYDLLKAVPPRAQLVLVGDVDQLPSVGPGRVLRDVIASERVPVVLLRTIFRQAERSRIVTNAHRVNRGEMPRLTPPAEGEESDFYFVSREEPEEALEAIKDLVAKRIPRRFGFHRIEEIQVLTPMHRGTLGAANLNAELQQLLNPKGKGIVRGSRVYRAGDKVLQMRNNYDLDVFNGDIGRVEAIDEIDRTVAVRFEDRLVRYDYGDLDELVLAYACSIHKAQGSEYPCVVIPIHTQHYVLLQRNLLYTGITRGKRLVVLVGTKRALAIAVRNNRTRERFTRLAPRLAGLAPPLPPALASPPPSAAPPPPPPPPV